MNRAGSMSLRARINNYAKRAGVSSQLALQGFFIERFLARIEKSTYAGNLVIKGGTLMCEILGLPQRTTMDVDATVVGLRVDEQTVVRIVESIASVDVGDGVSFSRDSTLQTPIAKDDEYGGWSIGLVAEFGTIRLPIGIDVTYGDAITPAPATREFSGVLDDKLRIKLLAYTVETLMAEKVQSILKRGVATTRPRDFYDLHMLVHCNSGVRFPERAMDPLPKANAVCQGHSLRGFDRLYNKFDERGERTMIFIHQIFSWQFAKHYGFTEGE